MVGQSDPPFRTLCLKYGATCVYTEMLYSNLIAHSCPADSGYSYLDCRLQDNDHTFYHADTFNNSDKCKSGNNSSDNSSSHDHPSIHRYSSRPLVVQLCGHDPQQLAEAARKILHTNRVDAIDFNLGCPQDRAKEGMYGSYLLDKCHWPLVFACVKAMVDAVQGLLPIHCKVHHPYHT